MKISYKHKLLLSFLVLFAVFSVGIVAIQQLKERRQKTEALQNQLESYANMAHATLVRSGGAVSSLDSLIAIFPSNVRLTLLCANGNVLYDNTIGELRTLENRATRPEILMACSEGSGTNIRMSATHRQEYLYFAKRYDVSCAGSTPHTLHRHYLRVALPYDVSLKKKLEGSRIFIYYVLALFAAMLLLMRVVAGRFGKSIRQLRDFMAAAESSSPTPLHVDFPPDELGEIGAKIVQSYKQLKQEMTSNIAHELRTPLTGIRGYLETILTQPLTPEQQQHFLNKAYNRVLSLSELIRDMGLIAKIEDTSQSFDLESVNISQLLHTLRSDLENSLREKNMEMRWDIGADVEVNGNRNLLYSIFRNLADNAIRYAGVSTTIHISRCGEDRSFHHFSFSDNGVGIPHEHHLHRLFERFYRVAGGRTRDSGGSGLGLSIVKNAVLFHGGGTIIAKNATGGGLEFLFKLPKGG